MHGEPVSASVQEWAYVERRETWLDGATGPATRTTLHGKYVLDVDLELGNRWVWEGPGADGDTIERLRLRPGGVLDEGAIAKFVEAMVLKYPGQTYQVVARVTDRWLRDREGK